ncbi:EamA family transporter RarD [Aquimixticola soesokkakensis]|nr:EamA family transporter RarD [Aquimixticola soesokkakensis]
MTLSDPQKGALALFGTYTAWGLLPLYYRHFADMPPVEMLAHRTLWTFVLFAAFMAMKGRLKELPLLFRAQFFKVLAAGVFIATNWFLYIGAVGAGKTIAASLGYYIFPLVSVLMGLVIFRERLHGMQIIAICLVAIAVGILTLGFGAPPYLSLGMAFSFAAYGAVKKTMTAGPILSVTGEVALLAPFALIWLVGAQLYGWGADATHPAGRFGSSLGDSLLIVLSGVFTGVPLLWFAYGAKRLTLVATGLGQYYNSSLQLAVAVFLFAEPFTRWHAIALPIIWFALALFMVQVWRDERAKSRALDMPLV